MCKRLSGKDFGVNHLDLSRVTIDFEKSQIIWAPNGVGKTSLYNALQQGQLDSASFTEFNNNRAEFVKSAKDTLRIGAHVQQLDELQERRKHLLDDCDMQRNLKDVGLTAARQIKETFPSYPNCKKEHAENLKVFSADSAKQLCDAVPEDDAKFFVSHWRGLSATESIKEDIESLKARMLDEISIHLLNWIDEDATVCPICGSENTEPIAKLIKSRKAALTDKESELLSDYAKAHPDRNAEEIQEGLRTLREAAANKGLGEKAVFCFAICGGRAQVVEHFKAAKKNLSIIDGEISNLMETKKRFYENLRKREIEITNLLKVKFGLEQDSIDFDDSAEELVVKLPRQLDCFSTGEVDLMVALVSINEFWASDSDVLVLDDPITSFDLANQYTILFDLIRMVRESNSDGFRKSVVILTHNTNCINIAESQCPVLFNYYSLDRWEDGLRLNPIKLNKDGVHRYLCQSAILSSVEEEPDEDISCNKIPLSEKRAYIEAVSSREQGEGRLHSIFHYDGPSGNIVYKNSQLSNDKLADLIDYTDACSLIGKNDFVETCLDKELVLIALRVWVEKQFYINMNGDPAYLQAIKGNTISNKIDYKFPRNGKSKWNGSAGVTRSFLMGKKVMLNQASHENAQSVPFEYALGLSVYEIQKTISDIKDHFKA